MTKKSTSSSILGTISNTIGTNKTSVNHTTNNMKTVNSSRNENDEISQKEEKDAMLLVEEEKKQDDEDQLHRTYDSSSPSPSPTSTKTAKEEGIVRSGVSKEIVKGVLRKKLMKMRHLVIEKAIHPGYLDSIFPDVLRLFHPQEVTYNGGIAKVNKWKISCYLEVMEGGIPCTNPNIELKSVCQPLLDTCNDLFIHWYKQQHACNNNSRSNNIDASRLMTFITRYTPAPGEEALLKHVDGAGTVDGSVVVALPIDRWSDLEEVNSFEGYGGGLTFWDGRKDSVSKRPMEIDYDTRSGDIAFIDRAVWHQANPIRKGTRWALVIFYKVHKRND